jgi:hypothetical protein
VAQTVNLGNSDNLACRGRLHKAWLGQPLLKNDVFATQSDIEDSSIKRTANQRMRRRPEYRPKNLPDDVFDESPLMGRGLDAAHFAAALDETARTPPGRPAP